MKTNSSMGVFFVLVSALILVACDRHSERVGIDPRPEVKASEDVTRSFQLEPVDAAPLGLDRTRVVIQKSALDKEFLMMGSLISQSPVPAFGGLRSRVIAFRRQEQKLFAMEATQGHVVAPETPQHLILTSFPILDETDETLTFDFNAGMSHIFVASEWYAQDFEGAGHSLGWESVDVRHSFIESASFSSDNRLVIRQLAQLETKKDGETVSMPVEVRYYLSPYNPDPTFKPLVQRDFDLFGFFEVAPQIHDDGTTVVRASHFHSEKPIVFSISANTPADFRQAVEDGILYWNKAFGKDLMQAVQLEDASVSAPHPEHNIVQWVKWDTAGFAFADAQMDPRSGEILHAQVFMTSAFAVGGRKSAQRILRELEAEDQRPLRLISLNGFERTPLCHRELRAALRHSLETLLRTDADDKVFLKLAQDYVREVVAHEVGHTLGLRHNFAGSLATNYSIKDRKGHFDSYLRDLKAPAGVVPSSSVMEYQVYEEGVLTGDLISQTDAPALSYDAKAMRRLYFKETFTRADVPPFCTDSHLSLGYLDCRQFDVGPSAVEFAAWSVASGLEQMPHRLLGAYIAAKAPDSAHAEPKPIAQVALDPKREAARVMGERYALYKSLTERGHFFKVRRTFPFLGPLMEEKVQSAENQYLVDELKRLGGLGQAAPILSDNYAVKMAARFSELLDSPAYSSGLNGDRAFAFSEEEKEIMRERVALFAEQLQTALVLRDLAALSGGLSPMEELLVKAGATLEESRLRDTELSFEFADLIKERLERYVFAVTEEKTVVEIPVPGEEADSTRLVTVYLPEYKYPQAVRLTAAGLFEAGRAKAPEWGVAERGRYATRFAEEIENILTVDPDDLEASELPRPALRWLLENSKVLEAFGD